MPFKILRVRHFSFYISISIDILRTCISLSIERHILGVFRLLDRLTGYGASAERAMSQKGPVYVSRAVAPWRGTVHPFEFHRRRRCHCRFVLLHWTSALQDPHLVPVGDRTSRSTTQQFRNVNGSIKIGSE